MDFIYQQIGLDDRLLQVVANNVIEKVKDELHSYKDNGPLDIRFEHEDKPHFDTIFRLLKEYEIILYRYWLNDDEDEQMGCKVFVTNRYKLELLSAELVWLARPEEEKGSDDNTAPYEDDVLYYDTKTGEMFFSGLHKTLKKRNKALLDVLFTASPNYVPRKKLLTIARSGKYANQPAKLVVNEAFTNLRKVCGVKAHTISLDSNGGRLNAETFPLSAQLPPRYFKTD
ncbi:MAG: hypothetical protein JWN38_135 [Candidatus Saccharibacteria bacterium]|nr:hypothetical protein [Candidatus Saccharibacteria bacterium]